MRIVSPPVEDRVLKEWTRNVAAQLNGISESKIHQRHNAHTAAPGAGSYNQGDFVPNKTPSELGTTPNKYVILGWICVDDSPLTFKECRCLTGG